MLIGENFVEISWLAMAIEEPAELNSSLADSSGSWSLPGQELYFGRMQDGMNVTMTYNASTGCLFSQQTMNSFGLYGSIYVNELGELVYFHCNAGKVCANSIDTNVSCSIDLDSDALRDCQVAVLLEPVPQSVLDSMPDGILALVIIASVAVFICILYFGHLMRQNELQERLKRHQKLNEIDVPRPEDFNNNDDERKSQDGSRASTIEEETEEKIQIELDTRPRQVPRAPDHPPPAHLVGRRTTTTPRNLPTPGGYKVAALVVEDGEVVEQAGPHSSKFNFESGQGEGLGMSQAATSSTRAAPAMSNQEMELQPVKILTPRSDK